MGIRNASKGLVLHDNRLLLIRCHTADLGVYYALPGGGQNPYETMEQALIRECLEETGYAVSPKAFVALYEEIYTEKLREEKGADYAHKMIHVFRCSLEPHKKVPPIEEDQNQIGSCWLSLDNLSQIHLLPFSIKETLQTLTQTPNPLYLGSHFIV